MSRGLSSFWDELVAAGDDPDRLLELIVRRAAEVVGEASVLTTVSGDGTTLEPAAVFHGDPDVRAFVREVLASEPYPIGQGVAGSVAARRAPAVLTDIQRGQLSMEAPHAMRFLERYPIHSVVVVPMVAFGEVVGTLGAVRMASPVPYDDEDVMALEALAERAALALAEVRRRPRPIGPAEYEAIFQHSVDGILFTAPDGRVLAANPAACHILGRSEEEICRAGRSELLVDDPRSRAAIAQRAIMGGARAELEMRRGNGEAFIADVASTIFTTGDGELRAAVMFRDVSERVRSRAELATQRDRLALLHRVATAINEASDLTAAIQHTLDAVGEATGWPLGDVLLLSPDGVLVPSAAWRIADSERFGWFRSWVAGGAPSTARPVDHGLARRVVTAAAPLWVSDLRATDLHGREPPGAEPLRSYVGVPVMVGSSVRGVIELFSNEPRPRDDGLLTLLGDLGTQLGRALERTEADAAHRRLDEERAAFIARAAHELRSPVASLMLAVGVLKSHELPDPQDQKLLELVADSTDHLNRLVNRLLDLSSLEHAVPQLSIEPVDVARVVERALTMHPAPAGRNVACRVPAGTRAMADELSLEEILTNLLGNAYGYGGDLIEVDASLEGDRLRLVVADNGVGIEPEMEASIFEPFVRGSGRRSDGAGLGLPISRRLAEGMGGSLWYERREGDGSRFVVELPAGP